MIIGSPLLFEVVEALRCRWSNFEDIRIRNTVMGSRLVMVEIDLPGKARRAGLSHRPPDATFPPPGRTEESTLERILEGLLRSPSREPEPQTLGERALGMACLNACSAPFIPWETRDPMQDLDDQVQTVVTVGFFRAVLHQFGSVALRVVERKPASAFDRAPSEAKRVSFFDPGEFNRAVHGADLLFITGSVFVYGGIGRYLISAGAVPEIILIGPTASFLPDPLFRRGVSVMAGRKVLDSRKLEKAIRSDKCVGDIPSSVLQKVSIRSSKAHQYRCRHDAEG